MVQAFGLASGSYGYELFEFALATGFPRSAMRWNALEIPKYKRAIRPRLSKEKKPSA
jgi:hypothetical protein